MCFEDVNPSKKFICNTYSRYIATERFSPNSEWHLNTMINVIKLVRKVCFINLFHSFRLETMFRRQETFKGIKIFNNLGGCKRDDTACFFNSQAPGIRNKATFPMCSTRFGQRTTASSNCFLVYWGVWRFTHKPLGKWRRGTFLLFNL